MNDRLQWTTRLGLIAGALSLALLAVSPSAWAAHMHNASPSNSPSGTKVIQTFTWPPSSVPVTAHAKGSST